MPKPGWLADPSPIKRKKIAALYFALAALFPSLAAAQGTKAVEEPEQVAITSRHFTSRPISALQQGRFIEILCNVIPSIAAQ